MFFEFLVIPFYIIQVSDLRSVPPYRQLYFGRLLDCFISADCSTALFRQTARQLVGKTRWVFRRPNGVYAEWGHAGDFPYGWGFLIGPMRLTEDPAGLPYKLSSRPIGYIGIIRIYRIYPIISDYIRIYPIISESIRFPNLSGLSESIRKILSPLPNPGT
jgi:hypothetical protein